MQGGNSVVFIGQSGINIHHLDKEKITEVGNVERIMNSVNRKNLMIKVGLEFFIIKMEESGEAGKRIKV